MINIEIPMWMFALSGIVLYFAIGVFIARAIYKQEKSMDNAAMAILFWGPLAFLMLAISPFILLCIGVGKILQFLITWRNK